MSIRKVFIVVAFVVLATSFGIPSQVAATPAIPKSLGATVRLTSSVLPGTEKTFAVPMPWRANMIGISFVSPARQKGVTLAARSHDGNGWSGWEKLDENDNGGDGIEAKHESARITSEPLWIGTADGLDVRIAVADGARALHDVRVHLINTLGNAKPQSTAAKALHALGRFLRTQGNVRPVEAAPAKPAIITRAQWGADSSHLNLPCPGMSDEVRMVFVHHTDTTNSYSRSTSAAIVRGIYRYHTDSRGYCDIAYNFLVDKYGQVFEGRNGGITNPVIGAHTLGFNYETVGVALLGNFSSTTPTSAMFSSLNKLLAWRMDVAHIPPVGKVTMIYRSNVKWKRGTHVSLNRISGHRDGFPTACPGAQVYSRLPRIRDGVNKTGRPKIYLPKQSTSSIRPDGDSLQEKVTFKATLSNAAHWAVTFTDSGGTARRKLSSYGSTISATWGGHKADGTFAPTGRYTWTMTARDSSGRSATPASGRLYVITGHPNGTLLSDTNGKYLVQGGAARSAASTEYWSYTSMFGRFPVLATGPAERARYTVGAPVALREGSLLVDQQGEHYIWSDGAVRQFDTNGNGGDAFQALGYQSANALSVSNAYIAALAQGTSVASNDLVHPDGTLVKVVQTGTARYYVVAANQTQLRPASLLSVKTWYRGGEGVGPTASELALRATPGPAFQPRDGTFIKATDGGAPWLVSDGKKRRFISGTLASLMGYSSSVLRTATSAEINAIPTGARIG